MSAKNRFAAAAFVGMICTLALAWPAAARTIYVDDDAPGDPGPGNPAVSDPLEDGSATHPFDAIQQAINAAVAGDTVLVADGTYTGTGNKNLDFAGKPITVRSASGNPATCVIDCEASGQGFYFHSGETAASVVAGLTVQNGLVTTASPGSNSGGGVYCSSSSPALSNCTISGNTASFGAGVCCRSSASPTLTNCTIARNAASATGAYNSAFGGGVYCYDHSSPRLTNCAINENSASASAPTDIVYGRGGGVYCYDFCSPTLTNCTISGNTTSSNSSYSIPTSAGAGVYIGYHSTPALRDCSITGNSASLSGPSSGGAGVYCESSNPTLASCTISGNSTGAGGIGDGAGLYCDSSSPTVTNCTIIGNGASSSSGRGGGVYCYYNSNATLISCTISGNTAASGGGVYCRISSGPTLTNCTISGNRSKSSGGGISCGAGAVLTHCTISGNTASCGSDEYDGGGVYCGSGTVLDDCVIVGNRTAHVGGGVYSAGSSITNCVISGNTASAGGGVYCSDSASTLVSNTISGNAASSVGGGAYFYGTSSTRTLANCILWGDSPQEIYGTPVVTYCDIQGGFTGTGNISINPGFALVDDFHLMPASPCIDAGTNTPTGGLPGLDADGNSRSLDGNGDGVAVADMGAYEFNPTAPAIAVAPRIEFFVSEGQTIPQAQTLSIRNAGGGTLSWTLDWPTSWLQANAVQGQSTGEVNTVTLTADADALSHGAHSTTLTVSDAQASNSPRLVEVVLYVSSTLHVPSGYSTIQAAIDAAVPGDEVLVADGVYTGAGNRDLDFRGKAITLRSVSGDPAACIIDCQGAGRGFYFYSGETAATVVAGLMIRNGYADYDSPGHDHGGGIFCYQFSSPTLTNCAIIAGHSTRDGGGVYCSYFCNPTLTNCTICDNTVGTIGAGVFCEHSSSPTLTNCTIAGNRAPNTDSTDDGHGAGVYCRSSSNPMLANCVISGNSAAHFGGAVYCTSSNPTLTNCVISGNSASYSGSYARGGGVYCYSSSPTLANCTITENSTSGYGGGMYCEYSSSPKLTNCILWADAPQEIYTSSSTPIVTYCDVQGGYTGTRNINVDPAFSFTDDFHLLAGSPCIDAGTNTPIGGLPAQDADGNPRPLDGNGDGQAVADMGAYEYAFGPVAPVIAVNRSRIEFFLAAGQSSPQIQTLSVRNAGGGTLNWTLAWDAPWLRVDPAVGESTGDVDTVTMTADAAMLSRGVYPTLLMVVAPQAPNSPRVVEVVLYVCGTLHVPGEYPTIQAAIDAATIPGDEVVVADGVYVGEGNKDLDFSGKAITVRSASGDPAACIIDCQGNGRGFYFHCGETAAAAVAGLTIRNGNVTTSSPGSYYGGGVHCNWYSSPTLTNCVLTGNRASDGAAVYCDDSSPALINCTIAGNVSPSYRGGLFGRDTSSPRLTNCILWGNTKSEILVTYGSPVVTYCDIRGGYTGTGNLNLDPLFANAAAGDYHLGLLSPCIDRGDPASDFSLEPEPDGGRINMGAYGNTPEAETKGWIYIEAYNIVRKTRVGRTLFEYDLTTTVRNASSQGVTNLVATLLAAPSNVQVLDAVVNVGSVPAGSTVESVDTFTIRVDRSTLVSPLPISWRVTYGSGFAEFTTLLDLGPPRSPGDVNCDGRVDFDDINPFVLALTGAEGYYSEYPECDWLNADCNGDGLVDFDDINAFVALLTQ